MPCSTESMIGPAAESDLLSKMPSTPGRVWASISTMSHGCGWMLCAFSHLVSVTELTTYRSSSAGANRNRSRVRTGDGSKSSSCRVTSTTTQYWSPARTMLDRSRS